MADTQQSGRTIALFGDSGAGKTTQIGELAKFRYKLDKSRTLIHSADMGGYDSIMPLVRLGIVEVRTFDPEKDAIWTWIDTAVSGAEGFGVVAFDSATSMSESLLQSCAQLSASGQDIGGRPAPKFKIKGLDKTLNIGSNVDSHYMVVQAFMLDKIWKSTWMSRGGVDLVWTFSVHRGEKADETPVLGPKLAGKALTAAIPKWFKYTFRIASIPTIDGAPEHVLYLQEQADISGSVSFGNSRYPLDATTPLPSLIKPASLITALELIEAGQKEADEVLKEELGM